MTKDQTVSFQSLLFFVLATSAVSIAPGLYKLPFIILQGMMILRCFCLMHDLGHGNVFVKKSSNDLYGLLMSLICCIPYFSWKYIHHAHHKWNGYKDLDPTEDDIEFKSLSKIERFIANVVWKFWIPLLSFSLSVRTFWNIFKLRKYFHQKPEKLKYMVFSMFIIATVHISLYIWLKSAYITNFLLGYIFSLFMFDPLAVSQHVGIHHYHSHGEKVLPFKTAQQNQFTRTIIFPEWFSRNVILGFNYHSAHHVKPNIPGYQLEEMRKIKPDLEQNWWEWLKEFKSKKLEDLL